jgi:hypothetical protein
MCTFKDCNTSDMLYDRMADWIFHESSQHGPNDTDFSGSTSQGNDGEAHASESLKRRCPICSVVFTDLSTLQNHVALHLERFAAFSFPRLFYIDQDDSDGADSGVANFGQESESDGSEDSHSRRKSASSSKSGDSATENLQLVEAGPLDAMDHVTHPRRGIVTSSGISLQQLEYPNIDDAQSDGGAHWARLIASTGQYTRFHDEDDVRSR